MILQVEDAKRQAAKAMKNRDDIMKDNRRNDIQTEIRSIENKVDSLKHEIDDDQHALTSLRRNAESQQEIAMLQQQAMKGK